MFLFITPSPFSGSTPVPSKGPYESLYRVPSEEMRGLRLGEDRDIQLGLQHAGPCLSPGQYYQPHSYSVSDTLIIAAFQASAAHPRK